MPEIAIVGAGIAGLNAALTLQDAGLSCSIYEASNRVGGRMHSDATSWVDGMVSEWCGEFIDNDHKTLQQLIARFGLETTDLGQRKKDRTQRIMYFSNRFYGAEEVVRDFESLASILQPQAQEAGFPTTYKHFTETGYRLDHLSVYDWIEQYIEGGHTMPLGHILDSGCSGFFGLDTRLQSSLNLVYMFGPWVAEDEDEDEEDASRSGPMQGSCKIVGGNERLPQAIARSLPEGCIHLNHQLVAIKRSNSASIDQAPAGAINLAPTVGRKENHAITLTFATANGFSEIDCDHVILALPFSTLRQVDYSQAGFDSLKQSAITQLGYGTISKLFLQFDRPYWYEDGPWPRNGNGFIVTDLDIQTLWDASLGQAGSSGLLVDYTSGHRGAAYAPPAPYSTTVESESIQGYARNCLEQLERVFPGISAHYNGRAALSYPTGDPHLLGSYACWRVGQYTSFGGYEGVRQGPIHFAGEHCSVEAQGYMEGGAREGERAAREILQDYGQG